MKRAYKKRCLTFIQNTPAFHQKLAYFDKKPAYFSAIN